MSSNEIADLTGKQHKNVLTDIRLMLANLGLSSAGFSAVYKDQQLIERPCFNLPKRETLILVSACNPKDCLDERLYALYEPEDQSITGFFFLPPDPSNPSDTRIAFSRWFGKMPSKPRSDWLLDRAMTDLQPANTLPKQ